MRYLLLLTTLVSQNAYLVSSTPPAALLGPGYLPPLDLTSNSSVVPSAWSNFSDTIESYIRANQTLEGLVPNLGSYSFSMGAFSVHDPHAAEVLQYHHTGPEVKQSEVGVTEVDGDSVYHIESISKVFTVYITLIKIGSGYWDSPITDFVPELADFANQNPLPPLSVVDWKHVTLGTLAGQLSGILRDIAAFNNDPYFQTQATGSDLVSAGLPPLNGTTADTIDPCASFANSSVITCPRNEYFQAIVKQRPVFSPWTTPSYSNAAFVLLSLAVENITGTPFSRMFQEDLAKPLGLLSTTYGKLTDYTHAVVPGGNSSSAGAAFGVTNTNDAPASGVYSTVNDLAKFGLSILNSTLLCPEETRKWLKPITHTGSLDLSVGRPWEILRITQPVSGRINDLYTKDGDSQASAALLILSPDHDAGFSILVGGGSETAYANTVIADTITSIVLHALESQAMIEATNKFAGRYTAESPTLNSSIVLAVDPLHGSGLHVTSWISNSTDMFSYWADEAGDEMTLFPTGLQSDGQIAFRGTWGDSMFTSDVGPFTYQATTKAVWAEIGSFIYAGESLDLFIFDLDAKENVIAVTNAGTRDKLRKVT